MWQIVKGDSDKPLILKTCNQCKQVIESFDESTSLYKTMIVDLGLTSTSDLTNLEHGLAPYHWHPITKQTPDCLIPPLPFEIRERKERERQEAINAAVVKATQDRAATIPTSSSSSPEAISRIIKSVPGFPDRHAPYKDPKRRVYRNRGRPPKNIPRVTFPKLKSKPESETKEEAT